jgi:hypothetical protein
MALESKQAITSAQVQAKLKNESSSTEGDDRETLRSTI